MGQEQNPKIRRFLLFDACMPNLESCRKDGSCGTNKNILCIHRFKKGTEVLHTTPYIDFLRYYDFQVLLHFIYLIAKYRNQRELSSACEFYIVTKDLGFKKDAKKGFLGSVQTEWETRRRSKSVTLEFNGTQVTATLKLRSRRQKMVINIIEMPTEGYSTRDTIEELIVAF